MNLLKKETFKRDYNFIPLVFSLFKVLNLEHLVVRNKKERIKIQF